MRYSFLIVIMFLTLLPIRAAEPSEINGTAVDAATGEPVAGVIIKSKGSFTSTGKDGKFRFYLKEGADSVTFRGIGYETLTLPIGAEMARVALNPKSTQLHDVIVEAPDIYAKGDTLVFNVSRYAKPQDNAIIDVIKRLPGIKVEEDGTIKYQGKPINKFYLDGNDFIEGQYGLATNNISHKDVKSVEVMENHQPIKALEGIEFPEEAGINLKLKEDARSRWVGAGKAAAGMEPFLYDASIFTMRIAPKLQNMFTLKSADTGWNPANEITEHNIYPVFSNEYAASLWPEYISADIITTPLSERRTRDNISWLANGISAWKKGDSSMRLKLNYAADKLDYDSSVKTDYYSPEIPRFIQNNSFQTQSHNLSLSLNTETNKRGYYLKDLLNVSADWTDSESLISGSFNLSQDIKRRGLAATNDLKLVKRNEKRLFTLTSRNSISYRPDRLAVDYSNPAVQHLSALDARSTTETEFGRFTRFWKCYATVGVDLNYHRMDLSLSGMEEFDNTGVYNPFYSKAYAVPQIDYNRSGWYLSLKVPMKWLHYSIEGQHDYLSLSPLLSLRRQLTSKSEISTKTGYQLSAPQEYLMIAAPVLADYRNLFVSNGEGRYSHTVTATLSYRYRNPLKAFFFNIEADYSHLRRGLISNEIFIQDFIVSTYAEHISKSDNAAVKAGVSKGLGRSKMVVGCEISGSLAAASSMRDNVVIPYRQTTAKAAPYFKGSIIKWLSLNYEADYTFSTLTIQDSSSSCHSFWQSLFLTFLPSDKIQLSIGSEHFLTRFPEKNTANLILLDASAIWRLSNRIRLSLTGSNLLNRRRYEYQTYGTLSRSEHSFRIRGRNILLGIQYSF